MTTVAARAGVGGPHRRDREHSPTRAVATRAFCAPRKSPAKLLNAWPGCSDKTQTRTRPTTAKANGEWLVSAIAARVAAWPAPAAQAACLTWLSLVGRQGLEP